MNTVKTNKKTVALTAALAIMLAASAAMAARSLTCTVEKIEKSQVTLSCAATTGLTQGQTVTVRPKITKKIEGC